MATPQSFFKEINSGKFKAAYFFYGPEDYRMMEAEKFLAKQFLPDLQHTTNYRRIDAKRTNCAALMAELASFPMLGERQLFSVSNFQSYKPKELARILKMLSPADPNRIVLLCSPSSKVPKKNSTFFKAVTAAAEPVEFGMMKQAEASNIISKRLEKAGIGIDPDALGMFTSLVGGNRGALEGELAKLLNYKEKGERITTSDIKTVASGHETISIFAIADLVVSGDTAKLIRMVRQLIGEGNSPVTMMTLLQQHFTSLFLVKNGKPPLGNRMFLVGRFRSQASRYADGRLEEIIIEIAEAHSDMLKGVIGNKDMLLEMLLLKLTGENR